MNWRTKLLCNFSFKYKLFGFRDCTLQYSVIFLVFKGFTLYPVRSLAPHQNSVISEARRQVMTGLCLAVLMGWSCLPHTRVGVGAQPVYCSILEGVAVTLILWPQDAVTWIHFDSVHFQTDCSPSHSTGPWVHQESFSLGSTASRQLPCLSCNPPDTNLVSFCGKKMEHSLLHALLQEGNKGLIATFSFVCFPDWLPGHPLARHGAAFFAHNKVPGVFALSSIQMYSLTCNYFLMMIGNSNL